MPFPVRLQPRPTRVPVASTAANMLRAGLLYLATLCAACGLGPAEPGSFSVVFSWPDGRPLGESWVYARAEQGSVGARLQVAEAPIVPLSDAVTIAFPSVPHGTDYVVIVEIKAAPDKQARTLLFGQSSSFALRPGKHVDVDVALTLSAAPSAGENGDSSDAVRVVQANAAGRVNNARVTLSLAASGATRAVVAHDFSMQAGRQEVSLDATPRDGQRYLLEWNLDDELCEAVTCPDGPRMVFVQFANDWGYSSAIVDGRVVLDRVAPEVAATSISPSPARVGARVALRLDPTEPLGAVPTLQVSPEDPGFGPFSPLSGGAYVAQYVVPETSPDRQELTFSVVLEDRAGNVRNVTLEEPLLIDARAPALVWGPEVEPGVVGAGDAFRVSFELDEVVVVLPQVRVGGTEIGCAWSGTTMRHVVCDHVATAAEGSGERAIEIEVRDAAGNTARLTRGSVLYDTLPRCGDGKVDPGRGETCDAGAHNSSAPDASCRLNCLPRRCGDGVVDPAAGEVCDDGNLTPGDGCSADCRSDERCGNGTVDTQLGEQCDDGDLQSHDGCSSQCVLEAPVLHSAVHVGPVDGALLAYDGTRRRVLAFDSPYLWELDHNTWRRAPSAIRDGEVTSDVVTYDSARQRLVVIADGMNTFFDYMSVWEWDGARFVEADAGLGPGPLAREDAAATYVASAGHTLLFGGVDGDDDSLGDLWAWDGIRFRELGLQGDAPTPRRDAAMAYDPRRDRVVMFGGRTENWRGTNLGDLWEWDGQRWREIEVSGDGPSPRSGHVMAYDPVRERTVLAGGSTLDSEDSSEVWEWDGQDWDLRNGEGSPSHSDASLVFDQGSRRLLLFGGTGDDDLWLFDGLAWTLGSQMELGAGARLGHAMTYDAREGRGILFGGHHPEAYLDDSSDLHEVYLGDTWLWNGGAWNPLDTVGAPPPRSGHAMAHDPLRGVSILFGGVVGLDQPCASGCADTVQLGDTWELQGDTWREARVPEPAPQAGAACEMFYDQARARITLVAEGDAAGLSLWHWEQDRWSQQVSGGLQPSARRDYALAYDVARRRAVLFGGNSEGALLADTWEWDGDAWQPMAPTLSPGARGLHAMAYDAARGRVLLRGGSDHDGPLNDLWEWDGVTWTRLSLDEFYFAAPRAGHDMLFDAKHREIVVAGGTTGELTPDDALEFAETTTLRFDAYAPPDTCFDAGTEPLDCPGPDAREETCMEGQDGDGDGLVGCGDPDCFGSCAPLCNGTLMSCAPQWPTCGDGVCDGAEQCTTCSVDCGACPALCGNGDCEPVAGETPATCPGDCRD